MLSKIEEKIQDQMKQREKMDNFNRVFYVLLSVAFPFAIFLWDVAPVGGDTMSEPPTKLRIRVVKSK